MLSLFALPNSSVCSHIFLIYNQMAYHCAVQHCHNGSYRLKKWKSALCEVHNVKRDSPDCSCEPPFRLFTFPTRKSQSEKRDKWKVLLNRVDTKSKRLLSPSKDQRLCSEHFVEGKPTTDNPYPSIKLGYAGFEKKVKKICDQDHFGKLDVLRLRAKDTRPVISAKHATATSLEQTGDINQVNRNVPELVKRCSYPFTEHGELRGFAEKLVASILALTTLLFLIFKQMLSLKKDISSLWQQINNLNFETTTLKNNLVQVRQENAKLKIENTTLRNNIWQLQQEKSKLLQENELNKTTSKKLNKGSKKKSPRHFKRFITDKNVMYYTGVKSKKLLVLLHDYIKGFVVRRWYGRCYSEKQSNKFKSQTKTKKIGKKRFLVSIDELLLVLMRLRLGLGLQDLADRFCISQSLASKIFTSWLKALAAVLQHTIRIPDLETVLATKPARYRSQNLTNMICIIDATEFFIETPQNLSLQTMTWSDYKHHNTLKVVIAVCPNSYICYVSPVYEGRISDTELIKDCGFLEMLPPRSLIMADKGFNLHNECVRLNLALEIPPGRRGQSQMPTKDVLRTKKIANLRILVEQVISRLKRFKYLKNELSLVSSNMLDAAVVVCAALCNFMKPIYTD